MVQICMLSDKWLHIYRYLNQNESTKMRTYERTNGKMKRYTPLYKCWGYKQEGPGSLT